MKNLFKKQREKAIKKNKEKYLVDAQGRIVERSRELKDKNVSNNLTNIELIEPAKQILTQLEQLENSDFNSDKLVKKVEQGLSSYSELLIKSISEIGLRSSIYKVEVESMFGLNGYDLILYYAELDKANSPKEKFSPYIEVYSHNENNYSDCLTTLHVKLQNEKVEATFTDNTEELATYSENVKAVKFILGRGLEMLLGKLASELEKLVI